MGPGMKRAVIEHDAGTQTRGVVALAAAVDGAVAQRTAVDVLHGVDFAAGGPRCAFAHGLTERPEGGPDALEGHTRGAKFEAGLDYELPAWGGVEGGLGLDAAACPLAVIVLGGYEEGARAGELAVRRGCGVSFLLAV